MTDRELMQMALYYMDDGCGAYSDDYRKLIEALRARLSQCDRCGEVNPAEIHTCTPRAFTNVDDLIADLEKPGYVDRRQWKYDPMTGEPLIDGWPLYSGLPQPEQAPTNNGKYLTGYTAPPQREWQGLTDEEGYAIFEEARHGSDRPIGVLRGIRAIEAKLKEKNT